MGKKVYYTESKEIKAIAEKLRGRYINVVGYVDIEKIFFAFKGGDVSEDFTYEVSGIKDDWIKHSSDALSDLKLYCIAMSYDFYQKSMGALQEWIVLECLYSCAESMDGKLRRKDVHEFSRFLTTLENLNFSSDWRNNFHLPSLLEQETIVFALE